MANTSTGITAGGRLENTICVAITIGILATQCFWYSFNINWKPAKIALLTQFLFVLSRNITVLITTAVPSADCLAVTVVGLTLFALWNVALQSVLFLRAYAFTINNIWRKILIGTVAFLWLCILGARFFQISQTQVTSEPGSFCTSTTKGMATLMGLINFVLLVLSYWVLLLPFLWTIFQTLLYAEDSGSPTSKMWLRQAIVNFLCVFSIIVIEFLARFLPPIFPVMFSYSGVMFSLINIYEANIILFLVEDLRKELTTVASTYGAVSRTTSSTVSKHF
ncbi:hypothetical protein HDU91_001925 [Kappamyces sp. JEL0680]|nr:hypothetical protein HDU91_001925 [Kappamyces sp. JEL0680]